MTRRDWREKRIRGKRERERGNDNDRQERNEGTEEHWRRDAGEEEEHAFKDKGRSFAFYGWSRTFSIICKRNILLITLPFPISSTPSPTPSICNHHTTCKANVYCFHHCPFTFCLPYVIITTSIMGLYFIYHHISFVFVPKVPVMSPVISLSRFFSYQTISSPSHSHDARGDGTKNYMEQML